MTCSARVCLLMGAVFLLQEVGSEGQDNTGLLQQKLNIMTKPVESLSQLIQTGKTNSDSSIETHEQKFHEKSIQSNDASAILRAISPLRQAFQEEKSFHRKNFYKLETDISRLERDIGSLITDTKQVMAEVQNLDQGLEEARKEQATLRQTVDAVVKENKQFWSSQNQSTVANSQKIERLVQRVEGLAKDVNTLKKDKTQNIAEGQDMLQRLEDMNKHQEETRVQIAALGQKVDDVLKENEQFMAIQNKSIVANLEKIEGLEQRVKDVKLDILTNVHDVLAKAEENHTKKYEALIQEAVDSREKCQSGDHIGPHSATPSFPSIETVWFQPPFKNKPALVYGLKVLDSYAYTNVRFHGDIYEWTNTHFNLTVNKWSDTVMWGAKFSWMACP